MSAGAALMAALALAASGCGGPDAQQGKAAASKARTEVAGTFWKLNNATDSKDLKTDATGRFAACQGTGVAYGILASVQAGRDSTKLGAFTSALLSDYRGAGWHLRASGSQNYSATRNGVTVRLRVFGATDPASSLTIQSGCIDAGSAASQIVANYRDGSPDYYYQSQAAARPVPSAFVPSP